MQIHLPAHMKTFLESLVERGRFLTVDEAILDALEILKDRETAVEARRVELRKLIDEGAKDIEEGRVAPFDKSAIMAKVDARLRAKQRQEANGCPE